MNIAEAGIRVGIHSGQQYCDYASYRELFVLAESLGLDWASVFDHFMPIQADPTGPCLEGYSLLAALAEVTNSIALGIIVTGVTYRHPAVLAKIATTIDHISQGRLEIGMGAAWYELEHGQYGIDFPSMPVRSEMLAEAAQVLKSLWTETETNFAGIHYQLSAARSEPKPVRPGGIPLWIGGAGERRTLPTVGRYADGWNTFLMPTDAYRHKMGIVAQAAEEAGRDPSQIRKALVFRSVLGTSESDAASNVSARAGQLHSTIEDVSQGAIIGTPDQLISELAPYVELGVGDFLLLARPPVDLPTLELLSKEVAPALRAL